MNNIPIRASFDEANIQWAWDATSLKAADKCPRYYQYSILEGWQNPFSSVHLWFGGLYASCLEQFHKLTADGMDREEAIHTVVLTAMTESWDFEKGEPITFDDSNKTRENLIRTLVWYFDFFAEDHFQTYHTTEGKAAVEFSFQLEAEQGITFCGHIDRLCLDPDGEMFVQDQKTTKTTLSPHYFEQFKPDHQMSLYTFAGKSIYNMPVKGVIVDAAQIVVGFSRFARHPVLFTEGELNEWYGEAIALIKETQERTAEGRLDRRPSACSQYGGCPYRRVCSRPKEVRANFLQGDFVQRDDAWDPIKRR